jgi:pimeloyl-ACP methyl ester carboxylesterase
MVTFDGLAGPIIGDHWPAADPAKGIVLLLHGGGQTRHSWREAGPTLSGQGWTTYSIDSRGHGDSGWAADGDYGLDALAGDLRAVLARLPERPVLIGASMGGLTGLITAGETPGLLRALVLVDITPRIERAGAERVATFMRSAPNGFGSLEEVAEAISSYQPDRPRRNNPEGLRKNVRQGPNGRWFWHWDPAMMQLPVGSVTSAADWQKRIRDAAARIEIPTLLVRGEKSDIVADEGVAELRELIPGARYLSVGEAGHMVAGDDNATFLGGTGSFLDEVAIS